MSIAYFILCHSSRPFLLELFRSIYDDENLYIVHCDRKSPPELLELATRLASSFENVRSLPNRLCSWGSFSLVSASLDGMNCALREGRNWSHFAILGESHLPLWSPDQVKERLEPGVSYAEVWPVAELPESGKADVRHRFALRYRELPGVGSFGSGPQALPRQWPERLYHGSQWMVLSRAACEGALESISRTEDWGAFEHSLLADETALQTLVMSLPGTDAHSVRVFNQTFVASPHLSGSNDIIFSVKNFFAAPALGHLFIRKRPAELPLSVQKYIDGISRFSKGDLETIIRRVEGPLPTTHDAGSSISVDHLATSLRLGLEEHYAGQGLEVVRPANSPRCFLRFSLAGWGEQVSVVVLSEDLVTFKVVLLLDSPINAEYRETLIAGYLVTTLKLRVHGLFLRNEVHLGSDVDYGFVTPPRGEEVDLLANVLRHYMAGGREIVGEITDFLPKHDSVTQSSLPRVESLSPIPFTISPRKQPNMVHIVDRGRPDLGGNMRHGDIHTFCPVLWRYLIDRFAVRSFLDVGCGEGHAVLFFHRAGVHSHGIDGLEINIRRAVAPIARHDLLAGPYLMPVDLVWSCEVAEHIDEGQVDHFLDTLANGRVVAMTHAVPGQGGYHHVNCQPADYWIEKMEERGYALCIDNEVFREISGREQTWNYFTKTGLVFARG